MPFAFEKHVFTVPSLPTAAQATEAITPTVAQATSAMTSRILILSTLLPRETAQGVGRTASRVGRTL